MKMFFDPPKTRQVHIDSHDGRRLTSKEISDLAGKRVKWTRRMGARLGVMLEGPRRGEEGILLYFPNPEDYDLAVAKVFAQQT